MTQEQIDQLSPLAATLTHLSLIPYWDNRYAPLRLSALTGLQELNFMGRTVQDAGACAELTGPVSAGAYFGLHGLMLERCSC